MTGRCLARLALAAVCAAACTKRPADGSTTKPVPRPKAGRASATTTTAACEMKERTPDPGAFFRRGVDLVDPYLLLDGQPAKDGSGKKSALRAGIACLDEAIERDPSYWQALWFRGKAYQALGDHAQAAASLQEAYAAERTNPNIGRELVIELIRTRRHDDAAKIAAQVSAGDPSDPSLKANLALALLMSGDGAGARKAIAEARRLDPSDAITQALDRRIEEITRGVRPQPRSLEELER